MPVPGALNIGDGGGKEESRLLGCGLEKRPPCPRVTELGGDAPTSGQRVLLKEGFDGKYLFSTGGPIPRMIMWVRLGLCL